MTDRRETNRSELALPFQLMAPKSSNVFVMSCMRDLNSPTLYVQSCLNFDKEDKMVTRRDAEAQR